MVKEMVSKYFGVIVCNATPGQKAYAIRHIKKLVPMVFTVA